MMTPSPRYRQHQSGLTLLEVMVAFAVLAIIMTMLWGVTNGIFRAHEFLMPFEERNHEVRVAMQRMHADLSMAYLSQNENTSIENRRTLFIGGSFGDVNELRFSSFAHQSLWGDANESDQTLIAYFGESDRQDGSKTNLLRRESRRLSNENWQQEPGDTDILLRDVKTLKLEYWDWQKREWQEDWNTTQQTGQPNRLPRRVRITVELEAPEDRTFKYTSQVQIPMQESLLFL